MDFVHAIKWLHLVHLSQRVKTMMQFKIESKYVEVTINDVVAKDFP